MIPVNAQPRTIVEYGGDPAENTVGSLVRDLVNRVQGRFGQKAVLGFDGSRETSFSGYAVSPQHFNGAASRAATTVVTKSGAFPEISSGVVSGPMGDPARRILAARLGRGQGY